MKIELISIVDMWEELKRFNDVWKDDDIFERGCDGRSLDDFISDVNKMYKNKEGFYFSGCWGLSDFVNINEFGVDIGDDNFGYLERDLIEE